MAYPFFNSIYDRDAYIRLIDPSDLHLYREIHIINEVYPDDSPKRTTNTHTHVWHEFSHLLERPLIAMNVPYTHDKVQVIVVTV